MTGKDVYLQMTWSWPDKTWNILCSYCLQWNTSQSKFRNHYFLFLFAFSILSQLFLIWGCCNYIIVTQLLSSSLIASSIHQGALWRQQKKQTQTRCKLSGTTVNLCLWISVNVTFSPSLMLGWDIVKVPWFSELQPVDFPCDIVCQRLLLAFTSSDANPENGDEERIWLLLSNDSQLPVAASIEAQTLAFTAKKLVKNCMPSIYEQLSVNTCGILGVQHNGRAPGQTDGVCLNTLVLLEYNEEEEETRLNSPPKPENAGFKWHEVTNQSLRTEILQKIQEGFVLPVQSIWMGTE